MKILVIGFLILSGWSAFSTHVWVCYVKGLCNEPVTIQTDNSNLKSPAEPDSLNKPVALTKPALPGNLLIYFEFDKSEFRSDSLTDRYYVESKTYLDSNAQALISITGYTDSIGSDQYNQALGYRRAQTMQNYFIQKGLMTDKISIESKGEKDPAAENNTATGRANNRRTVIIIKN